MRPLIKLCFSLLILLAPAPGRGAAVSTGTVAAGPAAPAIGELVTRALEEGQYEHKPVTGGTSPELMRLYLRMYDPVRMFFTAHDIGEFNSRFGADMALRLKDGDVEPAYFIFDRFMLRLNERIGWVHEFSRSTYTFTSDETILADRTKAPWPADEAQARELWRKRVEFDILQEKLDGAKPQDRAKDVEKNYDRLLDNYREFDSGDVLQNYLNALAGCYDPHSEYMAAPTEENFDITMSLSLVGIGVTLEKDDGYTKIISIVPGGPAAKSKAFHPNDRIEAVAQGTDGAFVEAAGMRLDRLVKLIRGEKGTIVRLRIAPADALDSSSRVVVTLVREQILLRDQQAKAQIVLVPRKDGHDLRLGVIQLPSFYAEMGPSGGESARRDVRILLDYLKQQGAAGVILDLRNNGGGSLEEAVAITGLFTGGGPVVQVRDGRGEVRVLSVPGGKQDYSGPLVVLTSRFSASASEIVAAALQDYRRAVLVGEKSTFGKGTVQSVLDLDQYMPQSLRQYKAGGLKLTIQKFYRVSGGSTQNGGVTPDIQLPSLNDYLDLTESSLPNAMAYDQISPAPYNSLKEATPAEIERLRAASAARVGSSMEFGFVRQDISLYLKHKKEKTLSLNYAIRLAERKEDEARQAERNKERADGKIPPLSVTDITLQDIASGKPLVLKSTAAMQVAFSSGAAGGVPAADAAVSAASGVVYSAEVSSAAPAGAEVSTSPAKGGDYARAPAVRDFELEEAARVLADLAAPPPAPPVQRHSPSAAAPATVKSR